MADLPATMKALVSPDYGEPSGYTISTEIPVPKITKPDEILLKVHAAAVNPGDTWVAAGRTKLFLPCTLPVTLGYDVSGTVLAVGEGVTKFKVGDEVFALVGQDYRGTIAEYCIAQEGDFAHKPTDISHVDAASFPSVSATVLGAIDLGNSVLDGGLEGKTVLVPAGLSGTGSIALQILRNVYKVGKVITTVSTPKVNKISELLPGITDVVIDYTQPGGIKVSLQPKSVDFVLDTIGCSMSFLPYIRSGGAVISIAQVPPPSSSFKGKFPVPWWMKIPCDLGNFFYTKMAGFYGVTYGHYLVGVDPPGPQLDEIKRFVEEHKLKAVVGATAKLDEIEKIKAGCEPLFLGKGGLGKFVVEVV